MPTTITQMGVLPEHENFSVSKDGKVSVSRGWHYHASAIDVANQKAVVDKLQTDVPWGTEYFSGAKLYAQGYSCQYKDPGKNQTEFVGIVHYLAEEFPGSNLAPWLRPALWGNSGRDIPYVTGHDVNGAPIINAARGLYDPVPEIPYGVTIFTCRFATSSQTVVNNWKAVRRKLNDAQVTIDGETIPIGRGLVRSVNSQETYWNGTKYWDMELVIETNDLDQGWNKRLIEVGWYYLDGNGDPQRCMDRELKSDGTPYDPPQYIVSAYPHFLSRAGADINDAVAQGTKDPEYSDFPVYKSATWPTIPS